MRLVFGVSADGRQHLDGLDRFILIANHNSHLDVFLLFQLLPSDQLLKTHPVAAYEYFCRPKALLWLVTFLFQPVWVVRGQSNRNPLQGMREQLARGHNLILFPEGTRGEAGEIAHFKAGIGQLATEFPDIPIVPVFMAGPDRALPKSQSIPVPLWNRLTIAPPLLFTGTRQQTTAALERRLRDLAASSAASRHRRSTPARDAPAVAVVGIDGSGKSTLARHLAQRLSRDGRVCLITDDITFYADGQAETAQLLLKEHLREAIGRRAKTAGSLKSYKIPKLTELLLRDAVIRDIRRWYAPDLIIMDGAPLINLTAWAGIYREAAFDEEICATALKVLTGLAEIDATDPVYTALPELETLKRIHLAKLELPAVVLFVDVAPAVSLARIEARGVERQVHETAQKLSRLRDGYQLVCRVVEERLDRPMSVIDGQQPLDDVIAFAIGQLRTMLGPRFPCGGSTTSESEVES